MHVCSLIRTQLLVLQGLTCLQQHTNTHTESSRESVTLLTGRLSFSGFNQQGSILSCNNLIEGKTEGQEKMYGVGGWSYQQYFTSLPWPDVAFDERQTDSITL